MDPRDVDAVANGERLIRKGDRVQSIFSGEQGVVEEVWIEKVLGRDAEVVKTAHGRVWVQPKIVRSAE